MVRYIVCATGKSAEEMLGILQNRLNNTPEEELINGAAEQNKITHLRLDKLLTELTSASL
jgi:2-oxo-4-hydroxy-4-carboxy-5-ureidoimidazoline decarboxylase